jgi:hypothetical protein
MFFLQAPIRGTPCAVPLYRNENAAVGGRRSVVDAGALSGRHSGREVS